MIEDTQLRLGNWVFDAKTKTYVRVEGIQYSGRIVVGDKSYDDFKRGIEPQPIPVTLEILAKSGLKNKPNSMHSMFWYIDDLSFRWREPKLVLMLQAGNKTWGIDVLYLHHLQNICHAMIGKELEINPHDNSLPPNPAS